MNTIEFKTPGIRQSTIFCLSLTAILSLVHSFIFKLSFTGLLSLYFTIFIMAILANFIFFRGQIQLKIEDDFLYVTWLKKPFYTKIKNVKIKLDTILKSSYIRSRYYDKITVILEASKTPIHINISHSSLKKVTIEHEFHKQLSALVNNSSSDKKLKSPYYKKYVSWTNKVKIGIFTLISILAALVIYLFSYNNENKTIQQFAIISFFTLTAMIILYEILKHNRKEFILE